MTASARLPLLCHIADNVCGIYILQIAVPEIHNFSVDHTQSTFVFKFRLFCHILLNPLNIGPTNILIFLGTKQNLKLGAKSSGVALLMEVIVV